jgi:hypothetical protein
VTHLVAAAAFAGFVACSLLVALAAAGRPAPDRQRSANLLILFVLGVTFTAGLSHRDLWPFSGWPMMSVPPPEEVGPELPFSWIYGVTAAGAEYPLDPRALDPISISELLSWLDYRLDEASPEQQRRIGALLLDRANLGRAAVRAGRAPGYLGPLGAPRHLLFGARWTEPEDVPDVPFTGVRWYRESWNIDRRLADPGTLTRSLGFEYAP